MDYIKLSKEISYALRHRPEKYGLTLDKEGFVKLESLLNALSYERPITKEDVIHIMDTASKQRFEIVGDKIRALYGHSTPNQIEKVESTPPNILYHGTSRQAIESIKNNGLLPMNRQYVHLSTDKEMATMVGSRRDKSPVILEINAKAAYNDGIKFYIGNDRVWLCDKLPAKYINNI